MARRSESTMSMVASASAYHVSLQKKFAASTASVMRSGAVGSSSAIVGWSVGLVSQSSPRMVYSPPTASHSWMVSVAMRWRYASFSVSWALGVAEPSGCHMGTCTLAGVVPCGGGAGVGGHGGVFLVG